jgi:hypothetical protein
MVETGLQLRLTQKLALAPQLQQAIRLLQLTRIELRQHIQQTVEANPLLEYEDLHSDSAPEEFADTADDPYAEDARESGEDFEAGYENNEDWGQETLPGENWSEPSGWEGERQIDDRSEDSLREHLLFQVSLGQFNPVDSAIATAIVFALDDDGYLPDSLEEIRASLAPDLVVELDEVRAVLRRIQRMEPVGVASRDPAECIRVQLSVLPANTPGLELRPHIPDALQHGNPRNSRVGYGRTPPGSDHGSAATKVRSTRRAGAAAHRVPGNNHCQGRRAGEAQKADRRARSVRRLLGSNHASAARGWLRVRQQNCWRLNTGKVYSRRRQGNSGGCTARRVGGSPHGGLQSGAVRRLLPLRGFERNGFQDGRHPGLQGGGSEVPPRVAGTTRRCAHHHSK